ncbi:MAG TPA: nucleoside triphosphate pyrophosphohydrolase [Terrimicrobiaceae bacterium]
MGDLSRLREIVARLRSPGGCPWDREQTHESLRAALVEECYEAVEAIERADDANLREELGDLLLLVVMHAHMAGERKAFGFEDVVEEICEKLIRRHPHVFGEARAVESAQVLRQWEQIKREEKGEGSSAMDGLPSAFPALLRAQHAQKKAARVGFDWDEAAQVLDKVEEEIEELRGAVAFGMSKNIEEELGDLLFSVVNLARKLGVDAETSLAAATRKFVGRFQAIEAKIAADGGKIEQTSPLEMNALWDAHKAATQPGT